jgi:hypothetical protein
VTTIGGCNRQLWPAAGRCERREEMAAHGACEAAKVEPCRRRCIGVMRVEHRVRHRTRGADRGLLCDCSLAVIQGDPESESETIGGMDELFKRWYHSHEEDTDDTVVYRPGEFPFPPARAARPSIEFRADGIYVEYQPGPADRAEPRAGRWSPLAGGDLRVSLGAESRTLEILSHDATVLRIRR